MSLFARLRLSVEFVVDIGGGDLWTHALQVVVVLGGATTGASTLRLPRPFSIKSHSSCLQMRTESLLCARHGTPPPPPSSNKHPP